LLFNFHVVFLPCLFSPGKSLCCNDYHYFLISRKQGCITGKYQF
jgi:hypothetical protein